MNQIRLSLLATTAAVLAVVCPASAQSVKVNWRVKAPFSDYRTFRLANHQETDFYTQFVPKYVTSALESKGLNQSTGNQPADLKVSFHFVTQNLMDATTTSDGFGWGGGPWGGWGGYGGWGGWGGMGMGGDGISTTQEHPRTMGILTIDLVDVRTNQVVWRGQATEDNVAQSQHGDENQVWKSIGKMFEHFPPKPEKEKH